MTAILEVLLYSLGLSVVLALLYKVLINPVEAKKAKSEVESYKTRIKEARKAGNMEEVNKLTMESLKVQQKSFSLTTKPMMLSFLLFFVFWAVIGSMYGGFCVQVDPEVPGDCSQTTNGGPFTLVSEHTMEFIENEEGNLVVIDGTEYKNGDFIELDGTHYQVFTVEAFSLFTMFSAPADNKVDFSLLLGRTPFNTPFIGNYVNWISFYILVTFPASMLFRKLFGAYPY